MKRVKQAIRKLTRKLGYDIVAYIPMAPAPHIPTYSERRNTWLGNLGITLLLDVGANAGQYSREVRQFGYKKRIISFEPLSDAFAKLKQASQNEPLWQCHNLALGDADETCEIHIAGNAGESSSILPMNDSHVQAMPFSAYVGKQTIQVNRLDSLRSRLLSVEDAIWLKIDVQGFEHKVLDGAVAVLEHVKAVELELSLVPLYEGSPLLCDSIAYLAKRGFQLICVDEVFRHERSQHTLQLNGIFERVSSAQNHVKQLEKGECCR
jgi:FkbM family methyltransferase